MASPKYNELFELANGRICKNGFNALGCTDCMKGIGIQSACHHTCNLTASESDYIS